MSEQLMPSKALAVETIPLFGIHLIEASAGTGKTFNITRIYLRMLLEKKLSVEQILVMTFTRAATQELKGRIRQEIKFALENWGNFEPSDIFYQNLQSRFTKNAVTPLLNNALLHIDQASIFTIHGFCSRVLTDQAFASGLNFNLDMEASTQNIELEAVRDYYRVLALQSPQLFTELCLKWPAPDSFYQSFVNVLSNNKTLHYTDTAKLSQQLVKEKRQILAELLANQEQIFAALIDSHKDKDKRHLEWQSLISWLEQKELTLMSKAAKDFLHGGRYKKAENKALVASALEFKKSYEEQLAQISNSQIYQLVYQAIIKIRHEIKLQKAKQKVMNFDDLITTLAMQLNNETNQGHAQLTELIRKQFPVALVDEFQDTDAQQYAILSAIYQQTKQNSSIDNTANALYMIGDPKQAIYGFRGGDIFTYLSARNDADFSWHMSTNWRSCAAMITGYNRLFYGQRLPDLTSSNYDDIALTDETFGFGISYQPVKAGAQATDKTLACKDNKKALELVYFPPLSQDLDNQSEPVNPATFRTIIANWCAAQIHNLLTSNTQTSAQPLQENDIAILVRNGTEAQEIKNALSEIGFASVYLSDRENIYASNQAKELFIVLDGIIDQQDIYKFNAALSTRLLGGTSDELYQAQHDENAWQQNKSKIETLSELWHNKGFMAMALHMVHQHYLPEPDRHERAMTNTLHLLELLQQASLKHQQPRQLLHFLQQQITLSNSNADATAELRLESDRNLIKIVTMHGSKGLEYPIVFVPFASRYSDPCRFGSKVLDIHQYHHRDTGKSITLLGQDKELLELARQEGIAESVRLLYVAITRAEQRCYVCATPFAQTELSPLGKTLAIESPSKLKDKLIELANDESQAIGVSEVTDTDFTPKTSQSDKFKAEQVEAAQFTGRIERNWWLSSFSALTRNLRHGGSISRPEHIDDELNSADEMKKHKIDSSKLLRFSMKKGAQTGNLLHDLLERIDFNQDNYLPLCQSIVEKNPELNQDYTGQDLALWLEEVLSAQLPLLAAETTSESQANQPRLIDLKPEQVVKEAEFYFPMEDTNLNELSQLLTRYRASNHASVINLPGRKHIQGMMHGFIDLIFEWQGKYYLADYKSTHLGNDFSSYGPEQLKQNMEKSYYDLQYLIYTVALHRFLKKNIRDYQIERDFGGVYYLYLRGMTSNNLADSNLNCQEKHPGIYASSLSADFINQLDNIFSADS
jgi:exodeoxyribonuclease V beta subunit